MSALSLWPACQHPAVPVDRHSWRYEPHAYIQPSGSLSLPHAELRAQAANALDRQMAGLKRRQVIRANPTDPLFFEYVWPPTATERAAPDPIDDWDAGLVGYDVDDIREIKTRVPLIELSNDLELACQQAAEIWRNGSGLDPSEEPPEGYAIWDSGGGCKFSYRPSEDN